MVRRRQRIRDGDLKHGGIKSAVAMRGKNISLSDVYRTGLFPSSFAGLYDYMGHAKCREAKPPTLGQRVSKRYHAIFSHISALLSGRCWFVGVPANRPMQLRPTDLLRSGTIGEHRLVYYDAPGKRKSKLNHSVQ
ncbi:hypothetical protein BDV37DRAFT_104807 [Aspergillus pseudonomiae]|uniref:Uncharacterized protein n=1 Tax=Aspergillus pseudonomiae TaxID=1506151 RepID=A0A5N7DEM9_9EURO|nr:uncharacterized protein BDV37DRAFT_104807 [Aspergillus pseudonomiae]KAE8404709.1 hypothetical protein BDV37DRAFT_104807 [Aspergillus pseudonomiae]